MVLRYLALIGGCFIALLLAACASPNQLDANQTSEQLRFSNTSWTVVNLPSKRKTIYTTHQEQGKDIIKAVAASSASLLKQRQYIEPHQLSKISFSWQTPMLIEAADMAERETEDSVVRVILSFEGDRSKFSNKNRMLSDLSQALTGEEMPYATLMYVWCNTCPVGSVITNPRTDRIRKLVVESGKGNLGKWLDYERDIRADFVKAFGEEPGALTGVALMTDTDNTQSKAMAWYGPISFKPPMP
jgi:hypothetical protein